MKKLLVLLCLLSAGVSAEEPKPKVLDIDWLVVLVATNQDINVPKAEPDVVRATYLSVNGKWGYYFPKASPWDMPLNFQCGEKPTKRIDYMVCYVMMDSVNMKCRLRVEIASSYALMTCLPNGGEEFYLWLLSPK